MSQTATGKSSTTITLEWLRDAVSKGAALRSRTRMQPAGGRGTKVFPPTYAGAAYATEKRRLPEREEPVECVLLDSVQSQANRMEEALQEAVDREQLSLPVVEVDFSPYFDEEKARLPEDQRGPMDLLDPVGRISSLQAPHRIADAILRDSLHEGTLFRQSEAGKAIDRADVRNATPLLDLCPTALIFGMWDSTGPKGGLGAKFERALVAEIVGIDAVYGVKTSSRIDSLGIQKNAGPLYRQEDGRWTLDPSEALDEKKNGKATGRKVLFKKDSKGKDVFHHPEQDADKLPDQGRPSVANHGNVTPDIGWEKDSNGNIVWYRRKEREDLAYDPQKDMWRRPAAGGVTIDYAEQSVVLSLAALRRLRFPLDGQTWEPTDEQRERDLAARTVLAALALTAATLAAEGGLDLRSRCLLCPEEPMQWELLGAGGTTTPLRVEADEAVRLLHEAVEAAKQAGLPWRSEPLTLTPSENLVKLVVKSQEQAAKQGGDSGEE